MIVTMTKMTFMGVYADKERFLKRLQEVGVTHLIHPKEPVEAQDSAKELARVIETRKFLSSRVAEGSPKELLPSSEICDKKEDLVQRETRLTGEIAALKKEVSLLDAWGEFKPGDVAKLKEQGLNIQFFRVSQKIFDELPLSDVFHRVISVSRGETCFVTLSFTPLDLDIGEEKLPLKSISSIQTEIEAKQEELKNIETEYARLAAHMDSLVQAEIELTNLVAYRRALLNSEEALDERLFIVKCWSPFSEAELVSKIGTSFPFYHYSEAATENDRVPVAMSNKPVFDSGEDLVKVYSYPSYDDFDPSGFVLYCFAFFFGMIIGDAGYGLTLLGIVILLHRKFKSDKPFAIRFFRLLYFLAISTTVCGVIGAGYFGVTLSPDNVLNEFALLDFNTKAGQNQAMVVSIMIGMAHISLALLLKFKNTRDYSSLGWIIVIWAGYFLTNSKMGQGVDNPPATYTLIFGLLVVLAFSSTNKNLLLRFLEGLNGLLGIVQVFSDVLSYLRLFALGIATVYMAQTFNSLAEDIITGMPGVGYVFAILVLFLGHTVNLLLAVMGGVIHGLRLNFLEWYRWCFVGDGLEYKPFCIVKQED